MLRSCFHTLVLSFTRPPGSLLVSSGALLPVSTHLSTWSRRVLDASVPPYFLSPRCFVYRNPQYRNDLSLFLGFPSWGIFNCGSGCYGTLHIYILVEFSRIPALNLEEFLFVYCSVCACVCGCRHSCATVHVESENNLWESVLCCFLVGSMDKARDIKHACQCHYPRRRLSHLSLKYFLVILLITVALR